MKLDNLRPFLISAIFLLWVGLVATILSGCAGYRADFRHGRTVQTGHTIERITEKLESVKARHEKQVDLFNVTKGQEILRREYRDSK